MPPWCLFWHLGFDCGWLLASFGLVCEPWCWLYEMGSGIVLVSSIYGCRYVFCWLWLITSHIFLCRVVMTRGNFLSESKEYINPECCVWGRKSDDSCLFLSGWECARLPFAITLCETKLSWAHRGIPLRCCMIAVQESLCLLMGFCWGFVYGVPISLPWSLLELSSPWWFSEKEKSGCFLWEWSDRFIYITTVHGLAYFCGLVHRGERDRVGEIHLLHVCSQRTIEQSTSLIGYLSLLNLLFWGFFCDCISWWFVWRGLLVVPRIHIRMLRYFCERVGSCLPLCSLISSCETTCTIRSVF